MLKINQIIKGTIQMMDENGNAILLHGKDKVIVRHALLHEEVRAKITKASKNGYIASIVEIQKKHPDHIKPPCPYAGLCGGCQLQHLSYEGQLSWKKQQIVQAVKKHRLPLHVHEVISSDVHAYRNKMIIGFAKNNQGILQAGLYEEYSHRIVPYERCMLHPQECDEVIQTIAALVKKLRIEPYDIKRRKGFLRHVQLRYGKTSGQILVTLITAHTQFPARKPFVQQLTQAHPAIKSIVMNINTRDTSVVLGSEERILYGEGWIEDQLLNKTFRISSSSFYQINHDQCERLYQKAYDLLQPKKTDRILDAYCGIGTIGLCLADQVKEVIGVEVNGQAIKDAITNAKRNQIRNARFIKQDASTFIYQEAKQKQRYDAIILDPPRDGSTPTFLDACAQLDPRKIIYISCNPLTQLRDLSYLSKKGYICKEMFLYDMFPMSAHVETVVLLSHKKPDGHINVKVEFGEGKGKVPLDNIAKRAEAYKPKERVTYKMIKEYIEAKYGFKVHTAYIAEVKRSLGLPMYDAPNAVEELKQPRKHPTAEKVEAIKDALKYFEVI